jgi:hypothetical protein
MLTYFWYNAYLIKLLFRRIHEYSFIKTKQSVNFRLHCNANLFYRTRIVIAQSNHPNYVVVRDNVVVVVFMLFLKLYRVLFLTLSTEANHQYIAIEMFLNYGVRWENSISKNTVGFQLIYIHCINTKCDRVPYIYIFCKSITSGMLYKRACC